MSSNIQAVLQDAIKILRNSEEKAATTDSRLEAEILLAHAMGVSRTHLYTWPEQILSPSHKNHFMELVARRAQGEPIAYITGEREFWSLNLKISEDVLIPRPETELIVETLLKVIPKTEANIQILELGTGSGAIALALAKECPHWRIVASDKSEKALGVASQNAKNLNICNNIEFYQGDWFEALLSSSSLSSFSSYYSSSSQLSQSSVPHFNAVVSNPPYIEAQDPHLREGDLRFEPKEALIADEYGLSCLRIIIENARKFLEKNGCIILEHGATQSIAVMSLLKKQGFINISTMKDLANLDRVTIGFNPGE